MLLSRSVAVLALSAGLASCAIRPLPEDVTEFDTAQIVVKVRCEMRDAIRAYAVKVARKDYPELAAILSTEAGFMKLDPALLPPDAKEEFDRYYTATVGYDFTFDITEANNNSWNIGLLEPLIRGPLTLGLAAGEERQRQNTRNFTIVDNFGDLTRKVDSNYCVHKGLRENWKYPITGSLKLNELVATFFELETESNLFGTVESPTASKLSDTILFTTKISGSANPGIEISPSVTSAGFKTDASRQDIHKVVITLRTPEEDEQTVESRATARREVIEELDRQENRQFRLRLEEDLARRRL